MENRCIFNRNWTNTLWIIVHKQNRRKRCRQISGIYTMFHKVPEDVVIEKRVNVSQDRITVRAINPSYGPIFPKFHNNHFIPAFNVDDIRSHVINPR